MSPWVDFRLLKQSLGIEQVLVSYGVELKRVGHHQLRGPCPLATHGSERSRQSFSVDTAKNVWACHSASCCEARQGRVGGNVLDLVAGLEGCSIRDAALRFQDRWWGGRAGIKVSDPQLASKGSSGSSRPDPLPRLRFSLRLRWHPIPGPARGSPVHGGLVWDRLLCWFRIPASSGCVSDPRWRGPTGCLCRTQHRWFRAAVPVPARLPQVTGGL